MIIEPIITKMLVEVEAQDLTPTGYIGTVAYLKWVQAVAIMHWERFAPEAAQAATLWIAVKHTILHHEAGRLDDKVLASTQIKKIKGVRALFGTTFSSKGRHLADVYSTWVCIDAFTKRPIALEAEILTDFHIASHQSF